MLLQRLRSIWNPAQYHGFRKKRNYFEGWYFKHISADRQHRYAIIPGIFKDTDPARAHSFVQVLDGMRGTSRYYRYPASEFKAADRHFEIWVGPNHFRADRIRLDLSSDAGTLSGELHYHGRQPWPVLPLSPGCMGPFAFIPVMEGFHGVLSFSHRIDGHLTIDGQRADFSDGIGYMEKDWGQQFPLGYVWLQSNHFDSAGTSLSASVATTKFMNYAFRGFIIGLWHGGEIYRFCTYTGAKIEELKVSDRHVQYCIRGKSGSGERRGRYRLEIEAEGSEGGLLKAPYGGDMIERVAESLTATAAVRLIREDGGEQVLFDEVGECAGLEVVGDISGVVSA